MRMLAVFGCGGHGKVVAEAATASGWQSVTFFDDRWPADRAFGPHAIAGDTKTLVARRHEFAGAVVAIGNSARRWQKHQLLRDAGLTMLTIVHPTAWVSPSARLGAGTVVMAGSVIQADTVAGEACIFNTCCSVDHDCRFGNAVHVAPGARLSGDVVAGDRTWIGLAAAVREGVRVGSDVIIGAGAVVVKNHGDGGTLIGCPARPAATRKTGAD